jgi:hypothetical protein
MVFAINEPGNIVGIINIAPELDLSWVTKGSIAVLVKTDQFFQGRRIIDHLD